MARKTLKLAKGKKNPGRLAMVYGPGGEFDPEWFPARSLGADSYEANFAVVDLETAIGLTDGAPYLIVT